MNISISNIAWKEEEDAEMYRFLQIMKFRGLEIAPTRIFPEEPYNQLEKAKMWAEELKDKYGLGISSMQSIWYGRTERLFGSNEERLVLKNYTKQAILFAEAIGCHNLVFGSPKNRDTGNWQHDMPIAIDFFREIGDYAMEHHTCIALEPNPIIYGTRFMNTTEQAVEVAYKSGSDAIKVNVDLGTILCNGEDLLYLKTILEYINHVHISEPRLALIEKRMDLHKKLFEIVKRLPNVYLSIEMSKQPISKVKDVLYYIKTLKDEMA